MVWWSAAFARKSSSWKVSTENPEENRRDSAVWMVIPCSPALETAIEASRRPKWYSSSPFTTGETTLVQRPITFSERGLPPSGLSAQEMRTLCSTWSSLPRQASPTASASLSAAAEDLAEADRKSRPIAKAYSKSALGTRLSASKKRTHWPPVSFLLTKSHVPDTYENFFPAPTWILDSLDKLRYS